MPRPNPLPVRYGPGTPRYVLIRLPRISPKALRLLGGFLMGCLLTSFAMKSWEKGSSDLPLGPLPTPLYLMDQAGEKVSDPTVFEQKVRQVAGELDIAPEWLMAVMYAESGFEAGVYNRKGSGAVGLIQFMPATANELHTSPQALAEMGAVDQLDFVAGYFARVKARYGAYRDLTDLYLAVLYPKARGRDYCYTLYARPSQAYRQNAGLDENRDGKVTVSDIHRRMLRLFPEAYVVQSG